MYPNMNHMQTCLQDLGTFLLLSYLWVWKTIVGNKDDIGHDCFKAVMDF